MRSPATVEHAINRHGSRQEWLLLARRLLHLRMILVHEILVTALFRAIGAQRCRHGRELTISCRALEHATRRRVALGLDRAVLVFIILLRRA